MVPCPAALDCLSLSAALGSSDFFGEAEETVQCTPGTSAAQKKREGASLVRFDCSDCKVLA